FGLQAEDGSPVVDQVELDVAAAPVELERTFGVAVRLASPLLDDGEVGVRQRRGKILDEGEDTRASGDLVEEHASYAAALLAVLDQEVVVAPLFETRVVTGVVAVAGALQSSVEMPGVVSFEIDGRE